MTESTPPEGQQPLTQAQIRQLHRSLTEQVLDRAASDPEWRQLLIEDPDRAMEDANFPEARELEQAPAEMEVVGQRRRGGYYGYGYGHYGYGYGYGRRRCRWHWSRRWGWYRTY
jgi:hypothetical protein